MAYGEAPGLDEVTARETAHLWPRLKDHVTPLEWSLQAPLIAEINRLKRERDAVILAHNYMTPEIFHGVGDYVGDSLGLAGEAAVMELYASDTTGTWTLTLLLPDGQMCLMASGSNYEAVTEKLPARGPRI